MRKRSRPAKPRPITGSPWVPVIELAPYGDRIEAAALAAEIPPRSLEVILDRYIRKYQEPPVTLADKKAHMGAIVTQGAKLLRLLNALRDGEQFRDFRADLHQQRSRADYMKILGRPDTPIEPTMLQELHATRDQLTHMMVSARWVLAKLKRRPPSPAKTLVARLTSLVTDGDKLRRLLVDLNAILADIAADHGTGNMKISDPARALRERKK